MTAGDFQPITTMKHQNLGNTARRHFMQGYHHKDANNVKEQQTDWGEVQGKGTGTGYTALARPLQKAPEVPSTWRDRRISWSV